MTFLRGVAKASTAILSKARSLRRYVDILCFLPASCEKPEVTGIDVARPGQLPGNQRLERSHRFLQQGIAMLPSMPATAEILHLGFLVKLLQPAIAWALACQGADEASPVLASWQSELLIICGP